MQSKKRLVADKLLSCTVSAKIEPGRSGFAVLKPELRNTEALQAFALHWSFERELGSLERKSAGASKLDCLCVSCIKCLTQCNLRQDSLPTNYRRAQSMTQSNLADPA